MKQKQDKTQQKQMPKQTDAQKKANDDTVNYPPPKGGWLQVSTNKT